MAIAIGLLHREISGRATDLDREKIARLAADNGHELATIVEVDADTVMPTVKTIEQLYRSKAAVVIAPTIDHAWTARRALVEHAQVIIGGDPFQIWPRGHRWPSLVPARPVIDG